MKRSVPTISRVLLAALLLSLLGQAPLAAPYRYLAENPHSDSEEFIDTGTDPMEKKLFQILKFVEDPTDPEAQEDIQTAAVVTALLFFGLPAMKGTGSQIFGLIPLAWKHITNRAKTPEARRAFLRHHEARLRQIENQLKGFFELQNSKSKKIKPAEKKAQLKNMAQKIIANIDALAKEEDARLEIKRTKPRARLSYDDENGHFVSEEEGRDPRPIKSPPETVRSVMRNHVNNCNNSYAALMENNKALRHQYAKNWIAPIGNTAGFVLAVKYTQKMMADYKEREGKSKQQMEMEKLIDAQRKMAKKTLIENELEKLPPEERAKFDEFYHIIHQTMLDNRVLMADYFKENLPEELKQSLNIDKMIADQLDASDAQARLQVAMRFALGKSIRNFEGSGATIQDILSYIATNDPAKQSTTATTFMIQVYTDTIAQLFPKLAFDATPKSKQMSLVSPLLEASLKKMWKLKKEIIKESSEVPKTSAAPPVMPATGLGVPATSAPITQVDIVFPKTPAMRLDAPHRQSPTSLNSLATTLAP